MNVHEKAFQDAALRYLGLTCPEQVVRLGAHVRVEVSLDAVYTGARGVTKHLRLTSLPLGTIDEIRTR